MSQRISAQQAGNPPAPAISSLNSSLTFPIARATRGSCRMVGDIPAHSPNQRYGYLVPRASRTPVIFANRKNGRVALQRMDNVGIVVESLDAAISFSPSWASNSKGEP